VLNAHPSLSATLAGENAAVIEVWQVVRDDVGGLLDELRTLSGRHSPAYFAGVRDRDLAEEAAPSLSPGERAARYLYLRATAQPDAGGGQPRSVASALYGRDTVPVDETGLRMLSRLLGDRDVEFLVRPPFGLLASVREGDVVWVDAAAAPVVSSARELRSLVGSAVARGAQVLAPAHPLLDGARELAALPASSDGDDDVVLLASAGLRHGRSGHGQTSPG
jgi:hypothetical protein